jgi:hypothetical protein
MHNAQEKGKPSPVSRDGLKATAMTTGCVLRSLDDAVGLNAG